MGGKKRKGEEEKKKQRVHLSSLDFPGRTVCTFFLSRAREQRPGNLIPFSIYLNPFTQTPLPTSSTFGLFLPFSACLPSAAVTSPSFSPSPPSSSQRYSFFSMARATASFHPSSSSERRHTFPPLLASFTNVALRIFGRVPEQSRRKRERGREGGDWLNR